MSLINSVKNVFFARNIAIIRLILEEAYHLQNTLQLDKNKAKISTKINT